MSKDNVSFPRKVYNYLGSIYNRIMDGFSQVSDEEHKRRYFICQECPFRDVEKDTCSICGCHLWSKTKWKSSECAFRKKPKW
jgi:hypothetical protein